MVTGAGAVGLRPAQVSNRITYLPEIRCHCVCLAQLSARIAPGSDSARQAPAAGTRLPSAHKSKHPPAEPGLFDCWPLKGA